MSNFVKNALAEDVGSGDLTAQLIGVDSLAKAQVVSRETAILCGIAWFNEVFKQLNSNIEIIWYVKDGDEIKSNQKLCDLEGSARDLLTGERTALNFIQLLSGTATQAHEYVKAARNAVVLDTRKTIPGLRKAQKYAVVCGGAKNHRMGLYDAFLIKENHIFAAGSIEKAVTAARQLVANLSIEVEVETLDELKDALRAGADIVLLDNFSLVQLEEAVAITQGKAKLEASGGVNLETIRAIANTGVDFISVGAITKDVKAIDLSMRFLS
ncbi:carboxylating nicotinate-nucleotide diphosphorylase [Candidatus Marithrix sp. Canyon 246]|uniref:carboxylating nicotinate-nucleotide diphosphorylase n=1 Tax=Candidatus Marithrix sp. Canyon 246 TaxID=1827136 RepID=UPI00209ACF83|nr:carboxylating nicotinate-nucleotide diphosphorylase [Candidatus Marithrix sp. Canyon 246]